MEKNRIVQSQNSIHFNGLNGIRAICALAVVISHSSLSLSLAGIKEGPVFEMAAYSVTAFFALSGFLITYLLMEEKNVKGNISVKFFYIRRLLRIWPLYFGYMAIALLADMYIFNFNNFSSIGYYLFFFPNIPFSYEMAGMNTIASIYLLGHFWSLGIEEQFYAFYPWLIKIFNKLLIVLISMFILVLIIKLIAKYISYKTGNPFWYSWADETRFDAMALGGIGAWGYKFRLPWVLKLIKPKFIQMLVAIFILLLISKSLMIPNSISHILMAGTTVILIFYAHLFEKPIINLRNKQIDYLGKISFGIYVYHPLAIGLTGLLFKQTELLPLIKIPAFFITIILFTILMAGLSFRYYENYFLKLKFKYAIIKNKD